MDNKETGAQKDVCLNLFDTNKILCSRPVKCKAVAW